MTKRLILVVLAGLAAGGLWSASGCGSETGSPPAAQAKGGSGPAVVVDAATTPAFLDQYKGKIVLMDFWATWCPPCREAMPGVQKLHEEFAGRPVAVLGVNVSESGDPKAYMAGKGFTYDLILNGEAMARKYNVQGIPRFVVLGLDGSTVLLDKTGYSPDNDKQIAAAIEKELKSKGL